MGKRENNIKSMSENIKNFKLKREKNLTKRNELLSDITNKTSREGHTQ